MASAAKSEDERGTPSSEESDELMPSQGNEVKASTQASTTERAVRTKLQPAPPAIFLEMKAKTPINSPEGFSKHSNIDISRSRSPSSPSLPHMSLPPTMSLPSLSLPTTPLTPLSLKPLLSMKTKKSAENLRNAINELIITEISYVKDLEILMTRFLTPLKRAALLPDEDVDALISNVKDIWEFHSIFSQSIEDARESDPNYASLKNTNDFRRMVFTIGSAFLYHIDSFNLYGTFYAVHLKAEKLFRPSLKKRNDSSKELIEFLESRVSTEAGTAQLGVLTYLTIPIGRILQYPLLIRAMKACFDPDSDTYYHLGEAHRSMQKVTNHINDMMKVHKQYGTVFESLLAANVPKDKKAKKASMVTELNMDDFVMYNTATWHNYAQDLGKDRSSSIKKDPEINVLLFNNAVVLVCKVKTCVKRRSVVAASQPTDDDGVSFKRLIPIADLQVTDPEDDDEGMNMFRWELTHSNTTDTLEDKVFKLSCDTLDLKTEFVKTIQKTFNMHMQNRIRILKDAGKAIAEEGFVFL